MNKKGKKNSKGRLSVLLTVICTVLLIGIILAVSSIFSTFSPQDDNQNDAIDISAPDASSQEQSPKNNDVKAPAQQDAPSSPAVTIPEEQIKEDIQPEQPKVDTPPAVPTYSPSDDPAAHIPVTADAPWNLVLVNPWNKLPADFEVKLTQLKNGHSVDQRAYPDLQQMMDDARAQGLSPIICSSFRTQAKQTTLFTNQVNRYLARGYEYDAAVAEAGMAVAIPGTSEHQLGLAVDIVAASYQMLDEAQENTDEQKWLMENSYKYGWILRYPSDKSDITGIIYEPWHYRYVGKEAAAEIYEKSICLEEYLAQLNQ